MDERVAVHGTGNLPLDGEYVAFDIETTGLDSRTDSIIEIGAVRMRGGEVIDRFASFASHQPDSRRKHRHNGQALSHAHRA